MFGWEDGGNGETDEEEGEEVGRDAEALEKGCCDKFGDVLLRGTPPPGFPRENT